MELNTNMTGNSLNVKRSKTGVFTMMLMMVFGAIFFAIGFGSIRSQSVDAGWTRIDGTIVNSDLRIRDGSNMYAPIVRYNVDGKQFEVASTVSSSAKPSIGQSQQVAYNPSSPAESKVVETIASSWWLYLFPLVGAAIFIAGPILYIKSLRRTKAIDKLVREGRKVQGVLADIQQQGNNSNSKSYVVIVAATDTNGAVRNYTSDLFTGAAGLMLSDLSRAAIVIDVYVNPTNPDDYYVDLSDIPSLTPQSIAAAIQSATQPSTTGLNQTQSVVPPSSPPANSETTSGIPNDRIV